MSRTTVFIFWTFSSLTLPRCQVCFKRSLWRWAGQSVKWAASTDWIYCHVLCCWLGLLQGEDRQGLSWVSGQRHRHCQHRSWLFPTHRHQSCETGGGLTHELALHTWKLSLPVNMTRVIIQSLWFCIICRSTRKKQFYLELYLLPWNYEHRQICRNTFLMEISKDNWQIVNDGNWSMDCCLTRRSLEDKRTLFCDSVHWWH